MRHAHEVPWHAFRRGKPLAARADFWVEGSRLLLVDVEIGAGEPPFLDCRKKCILIHGVPAADVDDNAFLRQAADKPSVKKVVGSGVGW